MNKVTNLSQTHLSPTVRITSMVLLYMPTKISMQRVHTLKTHLYSSNLMKCKIRNTALDATSKTAGSITKDMGNSIMMPNNYSHMITKIGIILMAITEMNIMVITEMINTI